MYFLALYLNVFTFIANIGVDQSLVKLSMPSSAISGTH